MRKKSSGLEASIPKNVFLKPLKFEFKDLFKGLAKGVGHTVAGKWEELAVDTVETLSAIGLATEPEELAFLLIRRSATKAMFELVGESAHIFPAEPTAKIEQLTSPLQEYISHDEFFVDRQFLAKPAELTLLFELQKLLRFWLEGNGVSAAAASAISDRLPTYFVYALNEEWRQNAKSYRPLAEALDTPFAKAAERESAWLAYEARLQKRTQESLFDEPFSLAQIFIPLNSYYFDETTSREPALSEMARPERRKRVVVRLQEELEEWALRGNAGDVLRIISGGPGSGKSSFARMFAASLAAKHRRVLFIPLHLIDAGKDLVSEVGRFVQDEGVLPANPLDSDTSELNLTIVFDGLDELASQGKAAAETARSFVREVEKTLERRNLQTIKLRVLVSGREVVVQENESEFRRNRQVLFLLPYFLPKGGESEGRNQDDEYDDPGGILKTDLRQQWWQNYGRLTARSYAGLPAQLQRDDLDEITEQPLPNYLLALSFTRGKVDFEADINLNLIYADLVTAVHERGYEKRRKHIRIREMSLNHFSRVLEEIGLAAWHGDGRTTTVREIEEHCKASGVSTLLDIFQEGAEAGITRLLAAFFFRRHGARDAGDPTFIFTHKSFGEYLTARRVIRGIDKVVRELRKREEDPDEGWDEREALKHWVLLCGPTAFSEYLRGFLLSEIALRPKDEILVWQERLVSLFSFMMRHGMPMEQTPVTPFHRAVFQSRNAEEALLVALNGCARKTEQISDIRAPEPTSFGGWFKRVQGQRSGPKSSLAANCLSFLNLNGVLIDTVDFYASDLERTQLRDSIAPWANLILANLRGANLREAYLQGANLQQANLRGTNLERAYLQGANLREANLQGANLQQADLRGADLREANLRGANLRGAILDGAKLEGAVLEGTILDTARRKPAPGQVRGTAT